MRISRLEQDVTYHNYVIDKYVIEVEGDESLDYPGVCIVVFSKVMRYGGLRRGGMGYPKISPDLHP